MIPYIFHFIYLGFTDFTYIHYLSVMSCKIINNPIKIFLYYHYLPKKPTQWWNKIQNIVTLEKVELPTSIFGNKITKYQHMADIIRLNKLIQKGGIYLDLDMISVRPLSCFLNNKCVMGKQCQYTKYEGLCNALIMAEKNSLFLRKWFSEYRYFDKSVWDYHSVKLPLKLCKKFPDLIKIFPDNYFFPFSWEQEYFMLNRNLDLKIHKCYTFHLWESIWDKTVLKDNNPTLLHKNSSFSRIINNIFYQKNDTYNSISIKLDYIRTREIDNTQYRKEDDKHIKPIKNIVKLRETHIKPIENIVKLRETHIKPIKNIVKLREPPINPIEKHIEKPIKPIEKLREPIENIVKLRETHIKPIEKLSKPIENIEKLIERHIKPIERHIKPIEKLSKPIKKLSKPIENIEKLREKHIKPIETLSKPIETNINLDKQEASDKFTIYQDIVISKNEYRCKKLDKYHISPIKYLSPYQINKRFKGELNLWYILKNSLRPNKNTYKVNDRTHLILEEQLTNIYLEKQIIYPSEYFCYGEILIENNKFNLVKTRKFYNKIILFKPYFTLEIIDRDKIPRINLLSINYHNRQKISTLPNQSINSTLNEIIDKELIYLGNQNNTIHFGYFKNEIDYNKYIWSKNVVIWEIDIKNSKFLVKLISKKYQIYLPKHHILPLTKIFYQGIKINTIPENTFLNKFKEITKDIN